MKQRDGKIGHCSILLEVTLRDPQFASQTKPYDGDGKLPRKA
jgi:hypothetical protein